MSQSLDLTLNLNYIPKRRNSQAEAEAEIPVQNAAAEKEAAREENYWRLNLQLTLGPLVLSGIPVHLLFFWQHEPHGKERPSLSPC